MSGFADQPTCGATISIQTRKECRETRAFRLLRISAMGVLSTHASSHVPYFIGEESARHDGPRTAIYLDTMIVSYLAARLSHRVSIARHQRITRIWWERYRYRHILWISDIVLNEATAGNIAQSKARLDTVSEITQLAADIQSERLAEKLVGGGRLPEKARTDARHVAVAATNSIPLLLSWNCKHLANPVIRRKLVRACEAEGFCCPEICTPEDLMRTYTHAKSTHR
jgi:hypothetical protein